MFKWNEKQWLALIFLLAVLIRLFFLPNTTVQVDEHVVFAWIKNPQMSFSEEVYPPGFHFLVKALLAITQSVALTRLVLMFFISLSVLFIFSIAKKLADSKTGLLAALFFALSPTAIVFSTHLRPHGFLMLLFVVTTFFVFKILERPKPWWEAIGLGIFYAFAFWLHYYAFLFIPVHAAMVLLARPSREKFKPFLGSLAVAFLLVLPLLPLLSLQFSSGWGIFQHFFSSPFSEQGIFSMLGPLVFLWIPLSKAAVFSNLFVLLASALLWLLFSGVSLLGIWRTKRKTRLFLILLSFGTYFLLFIGFLMQKILLWARYVMPALPFWLLLAALGVSGIQNKRLQKIVLAGMLLGQLAIVIELFLLFQFGRFDLIYL